MHITKTAGTSIEEAAQEKGILWGRFDLDLKALNSCGGGAFWHKPLRFLETNKLRRVLREFVFFAVVRNPYERVVSEFYCIWGGPKDKAVSKEIYNDIIYEKLLLLKQRIQGNKVVKGHWVPQYYYIFDKHGTKIIEHVIWYENLDKELKELFDKYELNIGPICRQNEGSNKYFSTKDLVSRNIALINEVYSKDFEYFGYKKQKP